MATLMVKQRMIPMIELELKLESALENGIEVYYSSFWIVAHTPAKSCLDLYRKKDVETVMHYCFFSEDINAIENLGGVFTFTLVDGKKISLADYAFLQLKKEEMLIPSWNRSEITFNKSKKQSDILCDVPRYPLYDGINTDPFEFNKWSKYSTGSNGDMWQFCVNGDLVHVFDYGDYTYLITGMKTSFIVELRKYHVRLKELVQQLSMTLFEKKYSDVARSLMTAHG